MIRANRRDMIHDENPNSLSPHTSITDSTRNLLR